MSDKTDIIIIKSYVNKCLNVIRMYDWLLDLYVLDFFVDNHWEKLPISWRESLDNVDPEQLGRVLCGKLTSTVFPLSMLALINVVKALSITRDNSHFMNSIKENVRAGGTHAHAFNHPNLKNIFSKHVKLKKRYEISVMADVVKNIADLCNCTSVIDFGSGVGHLIRILAYKHDLWTVGIESQTQLSEEARKLDLELEYTASKHLTAVQITKLKRPTHMNMTLTHEHQLLEAPLAEVMTSYGLVGLHPCGDLGPLLLKHFVKNERVKFICIVGCCYMKLSDSGYPMSEYVSGLRSHLSYVSREIACHAIEVYCDRLLQGKYDNLKVHAYRAALETVLVDIHPGLKHAPIRSIKHSTTMTFDRYCALATERLRVRVSGARRARGAALLAHWRRVLALYSLRLALAPLVETLILLDRVLFLLEKGVTCEIHPAFDPKLSPRNHIIIARR